MTSLLEVKDLCLDYGAVRALNHVSLKVEENEICRGPGRQRGG
jgi:ABC-type branched-subunit amino acid transport system ATPase component